LGARGHFRVKKCLGAQEPLGDLEPLGARVSWGHPGTLEFLKSLGGPGSLKKPIEFWGPRDSGGLEIAEGP
jgi:hypothetical protein